MQNLTVLPLPNICLEMVKLKSWNMWFSLFPLGDLKQIPVGLYASRCVIKIK